MARSRNPGTRSRIALRSMRAQPTAALAAQRCLPD
jgi:hypothetical protein